MLMHGVLLKIRGSLLYDNTFISCRLRRARATRNSDAHLSFTFADTRSYARFMTRYFFDVTDNNTLILDKEGSELHGLRAARAEAISILPDLAKGLELHGNRQTFAVTTRDATGKPVFQATLSLDCTWLE